MTNTRTSDLIESIVQQYLPYIT